LAAALEDLGRPAMIIESIAVIARGVRRHTMDIDATVAGAALDVDAVLATLVRPWRERALSAGRASG
jgi:hypothetical protein